MLSGWFIFYGSIASYLILALGVGLIAKKKKKDVITFFFLSLLITPLIGLMVLLIKTPDPSNSWTKVLKLIALYLEAALAFIFNCILWFITKIINLTFTLLTVITYGYGLFLLGFHVYNLLKEGNWRNDYFIDWISGLDRSIYEWKGIVEIFGYADFLVILIIALILTRITFYIFVNSLETDFKDWKYFLDK